MGGRDSAGQTERVQTAVKGSKNGQAEARK